MKEEPIIYFAHSLPGRPEEEWQPLEKHLKNVAEMAKGFAEEFGAGEWAYLAGLWHVMGTHKQCLSTIRIAKSLEVWRNNYA